MPTTLFNDPKKVEKRSANDSGSVVTSNDNTDEAGLLRTIDNIRNEAETHRDNFAPAWKEIEDQVNCVPPAEWADGPMISYPL